MSTFRNQLAKEMAIFINPKEFAEPHMIDGRMLNIVIDNDRLVERSKKEYDGISVGEILYYVSAKDYGERPSQGAPQIFDGRQMFVFDCREDGGTYEIILRQNRGM